MKIDKTFKIKEKYFNAILRFEKPFELRHEQVEPNSIIKLECENGRYLIFKSGKCELLKTDWDTKKNLILPTIYQSFEKQYTFGKYWNRYEWKTKSYDLVEIEPFAKIEYADGSNPVYWDRLNWFDEFCWEYINKAPTYLIEIAEIIEVK